MALIQSIAVSKLRFGGDQSTRILDNLYCKIIEVFSGKDETRIQVAWYFDEFSTNDLPIHLTSHVAPGSESAEYKAAIVAANGSSYTAVYEWLKTQDDFVGAVDA